MSNSSEFTMFVNDKIVEMKGVVEDNIRVKSQFKDISTRITYNSFRKYFINHFDAKDMPSFNKIISELNLILGIHNNGVWKEWKIKEV